jgi:prevent-host-death family protein
MDIATIDSNNARAKWRNLLDTASAGEDVVITRYGKPVTAMINYDDYIALIDELDDLRSARRAKIIIADLEAGRTTSRPLDDIEADLRAEGLLDD